MPGTYLHSGYFPLLLAAISAALIVLCIIVAIRLNKSWRDKNPK